MTDNAKLTPVRPTPTGLIHGVRERLDALERDLAAARTALAEAQAELVAAHQRFTPESVALTHCPGDRAARVVPVDQDSKDPNPDLTAAVSPACHADGLVALTAGTYGNVLRFLPPLVIGDGCSRRPRHLEASSASAPEAPDERMSGPTLVCHLQHDVRATASASSLICSRTSIARLDPPGFWRCVAREDGRSIPHTLLHGCVMRSR